MNAVSMYRSNRRNKAGVLFILIALTVLPAGATTQLLLSREQQAAGAAAEYKGVVELTVNPGFDNAKVSIVVDGEKLVDDLRVPYRVTVDFGPNTIEHRITITAVTPDRKRVQWHETINRGKLPLRLKVRAVDLDKRLFEADATAPGDDPIAAVELWDEGKVAASVTAAPYQFTVSESALAQGFVQVTARTRSGEEAADFWSAGGEVHVESVDVRTVPIFVSVVDRDGQTLDNVDRSLFRVLDNGAEAKIIEFGKAFDQPISIALLLDASASMTYWMGPVQKAAQGFVERTMRPGDRCSVFAVTDVPRRMQELTSDRETVAKALAGITPKGRTALYDAIGSAVRELRDEKNRRAIVILTDGSDTASIASYEETEKLAQESGVPLYFIAYDNGEVDWLKSVDRLKYLATQSGGFVVTASEQNLQAKYREIERDLRAQFAIRYQITDYAKHNEWRKVRVVLSSPKLTARTIRGYYAP